MRMASSEATEAGCGANSCYSIWSAVSKHWSESERLSGSDQRLLHQHSIEPTIEFETDVTERADVRDTIPQVQLDRAAILRVADDRNHLAVACRRTLSQQSL